MKILVVNWQDRLNPQAGGAEIHLHEVFGRLAGWGHDVTLLASSFSGAPSRQQLDSMEIHRVGGRLTFGARVPGYVRKVFGEGEFDVVVEDLNKVPVFMPYWTRAPVVLLVHHLFGGTAFQEAPLPMAAATWLLERPIPWVYKGLGVVVVSESTAQDLGRRGLKGSTIAVVPNGVDLEHYAPLPGDVEDPRPTLLYLGRLKKYKRVDLILRAAAFLRDGGLAVKLLIAGKGDHERELRALGVRLGLEGIVEFLGYVEEEEKVRLLRRSWIHVLTSPKEGWGIVNLEAAACGTPTVASDSPGLRDSVRNGETGLLVPHGDVKSLAGALRLLVEDASARRTMGVQAREFAEGFTWEASARTMEEFLQARVAGGAPHR
ncbi:glycosyltransferase family 4 protein [Gemmatimonadota bacterium]